MVKVPGYMQIKMDFVVRFAFLTELRKKKNTQAILVYSASYPYFFFLFFFFLRTCLS